MKTKFVKMKKLFALTILLTISICSFSQSDAIVGKWVSVDDETGEMKSVIEIFEKEGLFYGTVYKILRETDNPDPICSECEDYRKGQKILGMELISRMKYNQKDNEYHKGEIMDPENGNVYDCKIWLADDGNLKVRGYVAFFYRTQTWLPYTGE